MANLERLTPLNKLPVSESVPTVIKNNSIFEVANPFASSGNLALTPQRAVSDDDFDVEVISFEEKAKVVSNLTTKSERILEGKGKVISFFREAANYKLRNMDDFRNLAEQAAVMARLNAAACAPGDGHGLQANSSLSGAGELSALSNVTSIFSKAQGKHESGAHKHCEHGEDYGKCSKGCKAAA